MPQRVLFPKKWWHNGWIPSSSQMLSLCILVTSGVNVLEDTGKKHLCPMSLTDLISFNLTLWMPSDCAQLHLTSPLHLNVLSKIYLEDLSVPHFENCRNGKMVIEIENSGAGLSGYLNYISSFHFDVCQNAWDCKTEMKIKISWNAIKYDLFVKQAAGHC